MERWEASGLSAREFGIKEGFPSANLWSWKKRLAKAAAVRGTRESITFAPVHVKDRSALVRAEPLDAQRVALELALDGGVRIRVFAGADMGAVSELVSALSRRSSC